MACSSQQSSASSGEVSALRAYARRLVDSPAVHMDDDEAQAVAVVDGPEVVQEPKGMRRARCMTCHEPLPAGDVREHQRMCFGNFDLLQMHEEHPLSLMVSGLPLGLLVQVLQFANEVDDIWANSRLERGCRPNHMGRLFGLGWSRRWRTFLGPQAAGTQMLLEKGTNILKELLELPAMEAFRRNRERLMKTGVRVVPPLPHPDLGEVGVNCFVGKSYCPMLHVHSDGVLPDVIARSMVPFRPGNGCLDEAGCVICKGPQRGCLQCPCCPAHFDGNDTTLTVLVQWQPLRTTMHSCARMLFGNDFSGRAFPFQDGRLFVYDGKTLAHGVHLPTDEGTWVGMSFVGCNQ